MNNKASYRLHQTVGKKKTWRKSFKEVFMIIRWSSLLLLLQKLCWIFYNRVYVTDFVLNKFPAGFGAYLSLVRRAWGKCCHIFIAVHFKIVLYVVYKISPQVLCLLPRSVFFTQCISLSFFNICSFGEFLCIAIIDANYVFLYRGQLSIECISPSPFPPC